MADGDERSPVGEKASLGKFVKTQAKYGTLTTHKHVDTLYLKHCVKSEDTLQGISLSYGVTIEQIKRANQIWTNESIFLYECLLIPLPASDASRTNSCLINGDSQPHVSLDGATIVQKQETSSSRKRDREAAKNQSKSKPAVTISGLDFFNKLDNSLLTIKSNVNRLEEETSFPADASNPLSHLSPRRSAAARHRPRPAASDDLLAEPGLAFAPRRLATPPSAVRTSLERLEQQQDDIFQL